MEKQGDDKENMDEGDEEIAKKERRKSKRREKKTIGIEAKGGG